MFGQAGYFSVNSRPACVTAQVLINPLRIGSILALRGSGVTVPREYRGPAFQKDAIALTINTAQSSAGAALNVDFLGSNIAKLNGAIEGEALKLQTEASLPLLGNLRLDASFGPANANLTGKFDFTSDIKLPIAPGFRLDGLGRISGTLHVDQPMNGQPSGRVEAALNLLDVFSVSTSFSIDPEDIRNLAERAYQRLMDEARKKLDEAVAFVKAYIDGAIKFVGQRMEELGKLATVLANEFGANVERAINIIKDAGGTATLALNVAREGALALANFSYELVIGTLRQVFPNQVMDAMRDWAEEFGHTAQEFAENIAWLLQKGNFAVNVIATEAWRYVKNLGGFPAFANALASGNFNARQIADALHAFNAPIQTAGKAITELFGTDILEEALKHAYGVPAAQQFAGKAIREMGRFGRNVTNELRRGACRRLGICL